MPSVNERATASPIALNFVMIASDDDLVASALLPANDARM
jgi:hypothetical protein